MLATPTITVENGSWGPYNKLVIPRGKISGIYSNPPGFFSTFKGSDVMLTGIYPLKPTDGRGVIYSEPHSPRHPRAISLVCNEGSADSTFIQFTQDILLPVNLELDEEHPYTEYPVLPLYHSHVLWSYAPRISLVDDGKYSFSLVSAGAHLSIFDDETDEIDSNDEQDDGPRPGAQPKGSYRRRYSGPKNTPPNLCAPPIDYAALLIGNEAGEVTVVYDLEPSEDGSLVLPKQFTREELRALAFNDHLGVGLLITVPRSYFDLSSVIDLTARPTVPASATATVEKILRGEKPDGWDFMITGGFFGSGDASVVYYMHSAALESKSPTAKAASAFSASEKAKGVRMSLDAQGLTAAVQIAYGVEVPLPKTINRDMAITLEGTFADHFTSVVVPQWEREICRRALALDIRNPSSSSMVELLRLLNAIWEMPYGYFPVAKRVAVGVLADMMHLGHHTSPIDFVQLTLLPSFHESGMNPTNLLTVLASLAIHLNTIPEVEKRSVNGPDCTIETGAASAIDKTAEKEAEQTPSTPPSETNHVELEMPPAELPYSEESTDIDSASVPATRSCSIL